MHEEQALTLVRKLFACNFLHDQKVVVPAAWLNAYSKPNPMYRLRLSGCIYMSSLLEPHYTIVPPCSAWASWANAQGRLLR